MSRYQPKPKINYSPGSWIDYTHDSGGVRLAVGNSTWFAQETDDHGTIRQQQIDACVMSYVPEMYELAYHLASIDDTFISAAAMIAAIEKAREIVGRIDGSYWT